MLSEEEKEAIEFIKFYQQHCLKKEKENMKQYETVNDEEFVSKNLDTLLNLITKLQKENEEKDRELKALKEIKNIADSKITDLRKIKDYDKLQSEKWILQTKLQQKDKQIDLMAEIFYKRFKAELLLEYGFENEEQLKQYFAELAEKE